MIDNGQPIERKELRDLVLRVEEAEAVKGAGHDYFGILGLTMPPSGDAPSARRGAGPAPGVISSLGQKYTMVRPR